MQDDPDPPIRFLPPRRGPNPLLAIAAWVLWNFSPAIMMIASLTLGRSYTGIAPWPSTNVGLLLMYTGLLGGPFIIGISMYRRSSDDGLVGGLFTTIFMTGLIYIVNVIIAVAGCSRF